MSVDFDCRLFKGWLMTQQDREVLDELTNYKYENYYTYADYYDDDNNRPVFLGDHIGTIPAGSWMELDEWNRKYLDPILYDIKDGITNYPNLTELRLEVANNLDLYEIISEQPSMWLINQVH